MTSTRVALYLSFAFFFYVAQGAKVTFTNKCTYTVWPRTLTGDQKPQLSTTGFELATGASNSVDLPAPWSGRFWARTGCSNNNGMFSCAIADIASGQVGCNDAGAMWARTDYSNDNEEFSCATGDCATGLVECDGAGAIPPASLIEITVEANGGQDFYDVSNVDGFNVPMSVSPQGGSGDCKTSSCLANINAACPAVLQVRGSDGKVIACKSACLAFNQPQYCCTGDFNTPDKCRPTDYSQFFKQRCPDAYSYVYDNNNNTFTCSASPDYVITFCP